MQVMEQVLGLFKIKAGTEILQLTGNWLLNWCGMDVFSYFHDKGCLLYSNILYLQSK